MSARDRKILEELVRDSMLFGLSEQESMDYVKRRAVGIRISRSNFYAIKKRISQTEIDILEERLGNHARVDSDKESRYCYNDTSNLNFILSLF